MKENNIKGKIRDFILSSLKSTSTSESEDYLYVIKGKISYINPRPTAIFPFIILTENGRRYEPLLNRDSILFKTFVKEDFINEDLVFVISCKNSVTSTIVRVHFITKYSEDALQICNEIADEINKKSSGNEDHYFEAVEFDAETEKAIRSLPVNVQLEARMQLTARRFPLATSESDRKDLSKHELHQLYSVCKNTYPLSTQQRLDALFSHSVSDSKDMVKQILAVCTGYHPEKITIDELRHYLNEAVLYRDSEIENIVNTIDSNLLRGKGARILLVGPEGTGKSALAHAIATARKKPYVTVPFYSYANLVDLAGCSCVFDNSTPGSFYKKLMAVGTTDVTAIFDGIDRGNHGDTKNGDPDQSLQSILCGLYNDCFLEADYDMSRTLIICEAQNEASISAKIKSCFDTIIYLKGYSDEERFELAKQVLIPGILSTIPENVSSNIRIDDDSIRYVISTFCHDDGVKILANSLNTLILRIIDKGSNLLTHKMIDEFLNLENLSHDHIAVIHMNKSFFDSESYQIIEQKIAESRNDNEKAKSELAKKQLSVIYNIIKPRENDAEFVFDYKDFMRKVNASHDGMKDVKLAMARQFNRLAKLGKGGNLLLISSPGQGKTTLARSAAEAVGLPFFKISCNGVCDPNYFKGSLSCVNLGSEGIIAKALSTTGKKAVILLDEIDKLSSNTSMGHMVISSLLDLLDERKFSDSFLDGIRLELSEVIFIATANYSDQIPLEIINRFETVTMTPYSKKQQLNILRDYILPSICEENMCAGNISFTEEALSFLVDNYYFSTGARQLRTTASKIFETILLTKSSYTISPEDIVEIIGSPTKRGSVEDYDYVPGRVNGLGVNTLTGTGSISIIDCIKVEGASKVTGMLEGSALESIAVAKAAAASINPDCADSEYHIHFGAGEASVHKDGSSAGLALALAILSCQNNVSISGKNAFTGEIDIRGNIYAVGGVPEKIRGAIEAGCDRVFIPEQNFNQLKKEELEEFSADAEVIPVKKLNAVISKVMPSSEIKKFAS